MVEGIGPSNLNFEKLQQAAETLKTQAGEGAQSTDNPKFEEMLTELIRDVDAKQKAADESIQSLAAGDQDTSLQDVVMKLEEADVTFQLMKEIRNKLMAAYREVMSMK